MTENPPAPADADRGASSARLPVTEFAAEVQGGLSPFGEDVEFPLPPDAISYAHPTAEDRPHLLGDPGE